MHFARYTKIYEYMFGYAVVLRIGLVLLITAIETAPIHWKVKMYHPSYAFFAPTLKWLSLMPLFCCPFPNTLCLPPCFFPICPLQDVKQTSNLHTLWRVLMTHTYCSGVTCHQNLGRPWFQINIFKWMIVIIQKNTKTSLGVITFVYLHSTKCFTASTQYLPYFCS